MKGLFVSTMVVVLPLAQFGCDTGTYTLSAHRSADASTGSMLSGVDTGMDPGTDINNPSSLSQGKLYAIQLHGSAGGR